eukprot:CFRG0545T1
MEVDVGNKRTALSDVTDDNSENTNTRMMIKKPRTAILSTTTNAKPVPKDSGLQKLRTRPAPSQPMAPSTPIITGMRQPSVITNPDRTPMKGGTSVLAGNGLEVPRAFEDIMGETYKMSTTVCSRTVKLPPKNNINCSDWKRANKDFGNFIKELKDMVRMITEKAELFREECVTIEQRHVLEKNNESTGYSVRLRRERSRAEKAEKAHHTAEELLKASQQYAEDMKHRLDNQDSASKDEVQTLREQSTTYREKMSSLTTEIEQLRASHAMALGSYQQTQTFSEDKIDALTVKVEELQRTIQTKADEVRRLQAEINGMKNSVGTGEREVQLRDEKIGQLEGLVDAYKNEMKGLQDKLAEKESEMSRTLDTFATAQTSYLSQMGSLTASHQKDSDVILELQQVLASTKDEAESRCADLTQRLKDLTEMSTLQGKECTELKRLNDCLKAQSEDLLTKVAKADEHIADTADLLNERSVDISRLTAELERLTQQFQTKQQSWLSEISTLKDSNTTISKAFDAANRQSNALTAQLSTLKDTLTDSGTATNAAQIERLCKVTTENEDLKLKLASLEGSKKELLDARVRITELTDQLFNTEMARRALHNTVQDLKGKIRVCVRVRPLKQGFESDEPPIQYKGDGYGLNLMARGNRQAFTFDNVFPPSSKQAEVFDEVSQFVQSAIDGYNVCLFAYGQTGSGKTHTMQGELTGDERGIIIRSAEKVLSNVAKLTEEGWKYTLHASYFEIYNEAVKDLLQPSTNSNDTKGLPIRDTGPDGPYIEGLYSELVQSVDNVLALVKRAEGNRSVAGTDMNERSSRSHSVFVLKVIGRHEEKSKSIKGVLYLCDLAGSERLAKSGAEGDRLKETQAINKSLSSLADVCGSLKNKSGHVPYRNSKLTHVLQPCLSGSGKALMLVALSPEENSAHETLCSLRFAQQVSQTELGKAKAHTGEGKIDAKRQPETKTNAFVNPPNRKKKF